MWLGVVSWRRNSPHTPSLALHEIFFISEKNSYIEIMFGFIQLKYYKLGCQPQEKLSDTLQLPGQQAL